jgi:hypothetical protein
MITENLARSHSADIQNLARSHSAVDHIPKDPDIQKLTHSKDPDILK